MSRGLNSELKMNHSDKRFSIIYCPEYASYFAYDKRKKTSKVLQFNNGFRSESYVRKRRHFCKEFLINRIKEDKEYE